MSFSRADWVRMGTVVDIELIVVGIAPYCALKHV